MFVYNEKEFAFASKGGFDPSRYDATEYYMTHYDNFLQLCFFQENSESFSFSERAQIEKEINIAKRKMKYWSRQENFDKGKSAQLREKSNKVWQNKIKKIKDFA